MKNIKMESGKEFDWDMLKGSVPHDHAAATIRGLRAIDRYNIIEQIGEGTYGCAAAL